MKFLNIANLTLIACLAVSAHAADETSTEFAVGSGVAIGAASGIATGIKAGMQYRLEAIREYEDKTSIKAFSRISGTTEFGELDPVLRTFGHDDHVAVEYQLSEEKNREFHRRWLEREAAKEVDLERDARASARYYFNEKKIPRLQKEYTEMADAAAQRYLELKKQMALFDAGDFSQVKVHTFKAIVHPSKDKLTSETVKKVEKKAIDQGGKVTAIYHMPDKDWLQVQKIVGNARAVMKGTAVGAAVGLGVFAEELYMGALQTDIKQFQEDFTPSRAGAAAAKAGTR